MEPSDIEQYRGKRCIVEISDGDEKRYLEVVLSGLSPTGKFLKENGEWIPTSTINVVEDLEATPEEPYDDTWATNFFYDLKDINEKLPWYFLDKMISEKIRSKEDLIKIIESGGIHKWRHAGSKTIKLIKSKLFPQEVDSNLQVLDAADPVQGSATTKINTPIADSETACVAGVTGC